MFLFVDFFFCKQKTAYEMRISDWSSDGCSSDLPAKITDCGDCGRLTRMMRCCAAGVGTSKFFLPFMSRVMRQRPKLFSSNGFNSDRLVLPTAKISALSARIQR